MDFKESKLYFNFNNPNGSYFRIALMAVGNVNMLLILYFSINFQYTVLSGMGFPSNNTVEAPFNSGPYTMNECLS